MTKATRDPSDLERYLFPTRWPRTVVRPKAPPKLVFIDLNHWIRLARVELRGDLGEHSELLAATRRAVDAGSIEVVLTSGLFAEISKIRDPNQRAALTSLVEELSHFTYLLGPADLMRLEVEAALDHLAGNTINRFEAVDLLSATALRSFGLVGGLKIERDGVDVTEETLASNAELAARWPQILVEAERALLAGPSDAEASELRKTGYDPERGVSGFANNAKFETEWSKQLAPYRGARPIRDLVIARHMSLEIIEFLTESLLARGESLASLGFDLDLAREFVITMPVSSVFVSLLAHYHRQPDHRWTPNDLFDIDSLCVAIPYCDFVFTDAAARNAAQTTGLDEHFGTAMPRKPSGLATLLDGLVSS